MTPKDDIRVSLYKCTFEHLFRDSFDRVGALYYSSLRFMLLFLDSFILRSILVYIFGATISRDEKY